jgi:citrate lyase beta subunit
MDGTMDLQALAAETAGALALLWDAMGVTAEERASFTGAMVTDVAGIYAARVASQTLGFTRMWSIHPSQIRPILQAMAPSEKDIALACEVLLAAQQAAWAPISHGGQLHDRASYRFFWQVLERAHATGRAMPSQAQLFFKP